MELLNIYLPWQWVALVALVGIATVLSLNAWVPELPAVTGGGFKDDLKIFKSLEIWLCIFITAIGFGGFFAWISYIAPLLTDVSLFPKSSVPLWMMLIGVGMTVGVTVGGKLADRMSPSVAGLLMMFGTMSCLLLSFYFAHVQWFMPILVFLTAAFAMSQCPPIQMLLIQNSKNAEMFGSSLGQSSFNIGNSLGAFFWRYSFDDGLWISFATVSGSCYVNWRHIFLLYADSSEKITYDILFQLSLY